jgi:Ran GTPase-activating protein (RanGAP) involved in mRNA processing and transport
VNIGSDDDDKPIRSTSPKKPLQDTPLSPRHRFLKLLVMDGKHAPLPIIIRPNATDEQLNLAHRSLGDDYIIYLSSVITDLPNVSKISLRDNRLTDRGLGKFIDMLSNQTRIVEVDLSENKLDSASSEALAAYLKTNHCTLKTLRLSCADLDDGETALFMEALQENKSITHVDLSHNMIGGIGEKSAFIHSNSTSGGAAIAKAITSNSTLLHLDLSWNKLGPASAIHLGQALRLNNTLLYLNLAYNGIKNEGAEAIGSALLLNICLVQIDLSYNGIGSHGTIEIAVGLRMDEHVQYLNMSGNPIGDAGGRALLESMNYHAGRREICMYDCSFEEEAAVDHHDYDLAYPTGKYKLDMSQTRSRCILYELLRIATVRRGCCFRNMEHRYFPAQVSGHHAAGSRVMKRVMLQLGRRGNPASALGEPYGPWSRPYKRPRHPYTQMEALKWMRLVESLAPIDLTTGLVFVPPDHGELTFEFVSNFRCPCPIETLNASGQSRLVQLINSHPKERSSILRMARSLLIESYQLDEILESTEPKFRKEMLFYLLTCVRDTSNVPDLIKKYLPGIDGIRSLSSSLKNMFYICINSISGHYALDLTNPLDRMAGIRLMEISSYENAVARRLNPLWRTVGHGHTAQRQNRTNFRNEYYGRVLLPGGVNDEFFAKGLCDKPMGLLEFDFVSITRPCGGLDQPTFEDDDLDNILQSLNYYSTQDPRIMSSNMGPKCLRNANITYAKVVIDRRQRGIVLQQPTPKQLRSSPSSSYLPRTESAPAGTLGGISEADSPESSPRRRIAPSVTLARANSAMDAPGLLKKAPSVANMKQGSLRNLSASPAAAAVEKKRTVKRITSIPLFGNLVLDAECLLDPEMISTPEDILSFISKRKTQRKAGEKQISYIEKNLSSEDTSAILSDVESGIAMFMIDGNNNVDRIVVNLVIRLLNDPRDYLMEPIAMLRRTEEKKYELLGLELTDRSRLSHQILEILGLNKDNSFYDIGLFSGVNSQKILPTHRKWILGEDLILCGSEVHVFLKIPDWNSDAIAVIARETIAKLFGCYGVTENCVRVTSHKSTEVKATSEFSNYRFKTECVRNTILILHQIDVQVEGVAFTDRQLLKTTIEVPSRILGKSENLGCVWRWRPRTGVDKGTSKVDLNFTKSIYDVWGNKFFVLRNVASDAWMSCEQAQHMVLELPQFGPEGQPYRETALLILYSRILDLQNFHTLVENTLPLDGHSSLFNRIGWLNCLNAFSMDRFFQMDLSLPDNRLVASILAKLAAAEPGQNCIDPHFRRSVNDNYSRGWEMPANWTQESEDGQFDSVPHKGRFNIRYTSAAENGCKMLPHVRSMVQDKYLLLGVPLRSETDIYLSDAATADWDDVII